MSFVCRHRIPASLNLIVRARIMGSASTNYFQWFYFSFRGRTGRQAYWLFAILPAFLLGVALGIVNFVVHIPECTFLLIILAIAPLLVWSGTAVSVKRLH